MGGGTGTFTVLSGLKKFPYINLTAIVSSADDGGSNKKFRDEFGLLPPSDFRQCLLALANESESFNTLRKLMMYRFSKGIGLEGQTFGNILIAALTDIEGSQIKAFEEVGNILNIRGKIVPITVDNVRLMAKYENGSVVLGEHLIDEPEEFHDKKLRINNLFLNINSKIYSEAKKEINNSDYIILGPGDLYTSTIANLVVGEVKECIMRSKAKIIYIPNLMTKSGQTYGFSIKDHISEIIKYSGRVPDYVLVNNTELNSDALKEYKKLHDVPVVDDLDKEFDFKVIRDDLVSNQIQKKNSADKLYRSLIRHDSDKLAKIIISIIKNA